MIDIWLVLLLSVLTVPVVLFTAGPVRVVLGILFILFFPGYALIAALFPEKKALGYIERLALSFGLSIAVVPLAGLVLNYTPWGIRLDPIMVSLLLFILALSFVAYYRRKRLAPGDAFTPGIRAGFRSLRNAWALQKTADRVINVILGIAILAAVGTLGYVVATPVIGEKYTEFYILGPEGKADNYPQELAGGQPGKVIIGIINNEQTAVTYRVEVAVDGRRVQEISPVSLASRGGWEQTVSFTVTRPGKQMVQFNLYKGTETAAYHELHLWVEGK